MKQLGDRHENKHTINYLGYYALPQRNRLVAMPDTNAGANGCYPIRSLFLDNNDDKTLVKFTDKADINDFQ